MQRDSRSNAERCRAYRARRGATSRYVPTGSVSDASLRIQHLTNLNNIKTPMSNAERCLAYRIRRDRRNRISSPMSSATTSLLQHRLASVEPRSIISNAERSKSYRSRRRTANQGSPSNVPNITSPLHRDPSYEQCWQNATTKFNELFYSNDFGHSYTVCDRLWFRLDLKSAKSSHLTILNPLFGDVIHRLCASCRKSLDRGRVPQLSVSNGFKYQPMPSHLPKLDPLTRRLISPRLPFMAMRRLRRDSEFRIIGQVINMPVDVSTMVRSLPRNLDDDYAINVAIKRKLIHRSNYLSGYVKKRVIKTWLEFLVEQPLYVHGGIKIDRSLLDNVYIDAPDARLNDDLIEDLSGDLENECLLARQQTLLWDESRILEIAPAQHHRPLNLIYDWFSEELSFPDIYLGVGRSHPITVSPYMRATSEIRRTDRRGATPEHILYMAMKVIRLKVIDGMRNSFRTMRETANITRRMIEDRSFLQECIERNFSFLTSIPNSQQYWFNRKRDLFAMLRQLGKPTIFLTLSANELKWPNLLKLLSKLDGTMGEPVNDPLTDLSRSARCNLVSNDPVSCCVYFNKLVDVIMKILTSNNPSINPFGKYRVLDYFKRIESQQRGSSHAHILLWLENAPREEISEDMPVTVKLVTDLCSVSSADLGVDMYVNQVHNHTFTCYKRGEESCRFNIPFWPMKETRVLLPLTKEENILRELRKKAADIKKFLSTRSFQSYEHFLLEISQNESEYLDMIRSTLSRPTLLFKRDTTEIMTNTFNPWIGRSLNSNMDIQFILDEYSCAAYVVEYVNKSNRGMSNLHRELVKLHESHPEMEYDQLLQRLGAKVLNTVEMCAQEAAWYLLRLNMSESSRDVVYIPTVWPQERFKSYKSRTQLDLENVPPDSSDIWTKNLIQKYEDRKDCLKDICLADFVAWYTHDRRQNSESLDDDAVIIGPTRDYRKRKFARVIRYRGYDSCDVNNYKREMVTLFVPFKTELIDIIDRDRFIKLYDINIDLITSKRSEYEIGSNIQAIVEEMRLLQGTHMNDITTDSNIAREKTFVSGILDDSPENFDDLTVLNNASTIARVGIRSNVLPKEDYCRQMRTTNLKQRELILEFIHRLSDSTTEPIKIFFTGAAGTGKTYTLKLLMETINRYSQIQSCNHNAYLACASTGKAAVNLGGTTVHSAFRITQSRLMGDLPRIELHSIQSVLVNVKCIIIDEVSMISSDILRKIDRRLREMTGDLSDLWGGRSIIFCGDFKQLPPVKGTPVYKGTRNHLEGATLWQSLDYLELDQVMRQSDLIFSAMLTKLGCGMRFEAHEAAMIEQRFVTRQWADENLRGVTRLFFRNHQVDSFNQRMIDNGRDHLAVDIISGYSCNQELFSARNKLHKYSTMESAGMPFCISLAIGFPYMLTSNIDVEDGLVNGSIGILRYIEELPFDSSETNPKIRLWLEFNPANIGTRNRLKFRSTIISRRGEIGSAWTPISTRSASITLGTNIRCKRQ